MGWWARRLQVAAARSRSAAEDRWAGINEAIGTAFAGRTVTARWTVDVRHADRVVGAEGQPLFTLRSGDVRAADDRSCLCTVQQPLSSPLLLQHGPGPLLVRHFPTSPLVARMGAAPGRPVGVELLPLSEGVAVRYRDQPWARQTRSRGPLSYRFEAVADGEALGQLVDAAGVALLSDHRRYVRASDGGGGVLKEWTLQLIDNPLPDAWLVGILLGTRLLASPPPTRRKSL
jgi:hypothetical protein